jgi:hypothetical protein
MSVLIAGCIGIDEMRTPTQDHLKVVGGSASYAALSPSYFGPVNLVGIVGTDFPQSYLASSASAKSTQKEIAGRLRSLVKHPWKRRGWCRA